MQHGGGQVFGFSGESEPKLSFVGFFKRDLKFGAKFGFGSGDLRGAIISCRAGTATGQLRGDRSCSALRGRASDAFRHRSANRRVRPTKSIMNLSTLSHLFFKYLPLSSMRFHIAFQSTFFLLPFTFYLFSHGLDYSC
jgi:hypothetical protein